MVNIIPDIFEAKISCRKCDSEMERGYVSKRGIKLRAVKCSTCNSTIVHPADLNSLEHFEGLKGKIFNVKLRVVGNSHAISIPKEIVNFMNETHRNARNEMDDMVRLCFEDFKKLSLIFGGDGRTRR
jgi:hypothetical protein